MDNLALPPEVLTLTHQLEAAKLEEATTQFCYASLAPEYERTP